MKKNGGNIMLSVDSTIREIAQAHKSMKIVDIAFQINIDQNELKRALRYLGFKYIHKLRKWSCIFTDYKKDEYLERSLWSVIEEMRVNLSKKEFTQDEVKLLKELVQQQMETGMSGNISDDSIAILEAVQSIPCDSTSKKTFIIQDSLIDELDAFCDHHGIKKSDFLAVAIQDALRKYG